MRQTACALEWTEQPGGELPEADRAILSLISAGSRAEAARLAMQTYGPEVERYLQSVLGRGEDAREAYSQFAENVWRGLSRYRGEGTFRAWAFRIAWNAASDLRKSPWRRRAHFALGELAEMAAEGQTCTHEWVERRRRDLAALRECLTLEERALAALRVDQGLSWEDCAAVLSANGQAVSVNTLAKRYERMKEKLGRLARERGLVDG